HLVANDGEVSRRQHREDFARGTGELAKVDQLALQGENLVEEVLAWRFDDAIFQIVDPIVQGLENGKIAVYQGVDEVVKEEVGPPVHHVVTRIAPLLQRLQAS